MFQTVNEHILRIFKFFKNHKNIAKNSLIFLVTFIIVGLFFHFIRFPVVDGDSMLPTYHNGDRIVVLYTKDVSRGDIVTFWDDSLGEYLVKRIIAMGGDHVVIRDGYLFINGSPIYEPYIFEHRWADMIDDVDIVLEEGEIYALGDNRNNSTDSRILGPFTYDTVFGRVLR